MAKAGVVEQFLTFKRGFVMTRVVPKFATAAAVAAFAMVTWRVAREQCTVSWTAAEALVKLASLPSLVAA